MPGQGHVKRILLAHAAMVLLLSCAMLGYVLMDLLGGVESGRDPVPLFLLCTLAVVAAGFMAGYVLQLDVIEHFFVLAPWFALVYGLIVFATGAAPVAVTMSWFTAGALVLTVPWVIGALFGRWARAK